MLSTEKVGNKLCGLGKYIAKQSPYCIFWTLIFHRIVGNLVDFGLRFSLNLDFSSPYSSLNYDCGNHIGRSSVGHQPCSAPKSKCFEFGANQIPILLLAGINSRAFCSMSDVNKYACSSDGNRLKLSLLHPSAAPRSGRRSLVKQAIFVANRRPKTALTPFICRTECSSGDALCCSQRVWLDAVLEALERSSL